MNRNVNLRCAWMTALVVTALTSWTAAARANGGPVPVQVFQSRTEGYHTFRIPAIVRATNGTWLAFAEGRKNGGGDTGAIDLVLKRSFDNGLTWGPLQLYELGIKQPYERITFVALSTAFLDTPDLAPTSEDRNTRRSEP